MHRANFHRYIRLIGTSSAGGALAFGLRGDWNALLLLVFLCSAVFCAVSTIRYPQDAVLQFALSIGFYAVAFQGLLGPLDGAFVEMWLLLTVTYGFFQTISIFAWGSVFQDVSARLVVLPFAAVAWEFSRHWMTRQYDGAGLTFCLIGQALAADDYLLQSVDLAGVWLLTFIAVGLSSAVAALFIPKISSSLSTSFLAIVCAVFLGAYGYGYFRLSSSLAAKGIDPIFFCVCPKPPELRQVNKLETAISKFMEENQADEITIVYPETCLSWQDSEIQQAQKLLLYLSGIDGVTVITGAWYRNDDSFCNSCLMLRQGQVVAGYEKVYLAPFVERRPFGFQLLVDWGVIPKDVVRNVGTGCEFKDQNWEIRGTVVTPKVCYDLFFFDSNATDATNGLIVCCLDETFDQNQVFQKLSRVHSRLRAAESKQPVLRSSLDGISGAFDHLGNALQPCSNHGGFSIYRLEPAQEETTYEQYGDWFPISCLVFCVIATFLRPMRSANSGDKS